MASTKRASYLFKVSEFAPEVREGSVGGTLRIEPVPFISTECRGVAGEQDVLRGDLLGFDLRDGTSMDEAQGIADFLNQHLEKISITRFGDTEDAARDIRRSKHVRGIELERFSMIVGTLKEKLGGSDVPAAIEAMKAVESVATDLARGWSEAIIRSQAILEAFGRDEDLNA